MITPNAGYHLPGFVGLEKADIVLNVPVKYGAILVGATRVEETTKLAVLVDSREVLIGRIDGQPIQISDVHQDYTGKEYHERALGCPVELMLLQQIDNSACFALIDEAKMKVQQREPLRFCLGQIAGYGGDRIRHQRARVAYQLRIRALLKE